ncbi:MAG: glycosyltransferase, partial [Anaerolineae bacterium]|nr:glycosyltransferase [Anaerolineae bacterium]
MNQLHTAVSLRLCYLLPSPTLGMHQYTADLANRMAAVGHDVHLVTTTHYPAGRYSPDVTVHTPIATTNTGFSTESLNLSAIQNLQSAICNLQFDLVHLTGPHLWNPLLLRALRRAGIPTLHTIHDLDPHSGAGYGRLLHLWNGLVLRWSDHVLVHGDIYRRRLLAQGYPADRVTHTPLLHLFLGHDRQLAPYNSQFLIRTSQFATSMSSFVLFFGRLEAYKGVSTLLAAWSLLNRNPPFAIRHSLLLAGQG